ncbi:MAG TPA: sigma-70 family RNA polymerase sigma factor [Tepidisphaeraceae bacterium]|nr:sigma-70 family RNA polymerase sigma factor [Tepidisphaeraceae bacterium]
MPEQSGSEREWPKLLAQQFSRHSRLFFKLAYGVLRDSSAAEDACQQALLRALERPAELREVESLRAWLARIVVNESLQVRRRKKTEQRILTDHVIRSPSQSAEGEGWELREAILEAVERLPEPARSVVAMRLLDGMSGGQVKELLECSDAHVSRELHRGMELLRDVLREWDGRLEKIK